ncbi:transcription/translation regulatory transformer protein RfaH [Thiocapsa bogorovii]|uniref:transcription/translation regulatory transformer protein RfaH n=1 Tax=Thiocapsa bogorovii TaxID=521689 RepID=UPI001E46FB95|nr:transcription/translation regulatory transformer protein RfaH [Thiocapsa bogorovii]UHD16229.1 transcription/translation regulatory transformer protein RfaH [Thiocapsa bogorovii]
MRFLKLKTAEFEAIKRAIEQLRHEADHLRAPDALPARKRRIHDMHAWYVVHTKPRKETLAEANLQRQDFETYLPWYKRVAKHRGTWREITEPLFPRYLFLRINPDQQTVAPIRSTLGVTTLVTFGQCLRPVPNAVIDSLRRNGDAQTGLPKAPEQDFTTGQSVTINAGPFEGLQGIFDTTCGEERVAILLDILGNATNVVLARSSVVPA